MIVCYNCRNPEQVMTDCPETKGKPTISKKTYKKKVLKATWDSKSEFEEEVDTAHECFMTNENIPNVTPKSTLDECELSMKIGWNF